MKTDLAIIIPALNEAATIGQVIASIGGVGRIIVVDDGSTDGTGEIAGDAGADVVRLEVNRGYDGALQAGFERADELDCAFVITLDADGQHPQEMISIYVEQLEGGMDLVLGVRDRLQRFSEHVFAFLTDKTLGISDPLCGMKGYRLSLYRALGHFDSYGSVGTELALHSVRNGAKYVQIPIKTNERVDQPRFSRIARANWIILRAALIGIYRFGFRKR